jgi:hypothetical protein
MEENKESGTTLWLNLNPNDERAAIEVKTDHFFLGVFPAIENREQGYKIPVESKAICIKCDSEIKQYSSTSLGYGELRCRCSEWVCPISPFSGAAYVQDKLERVRPFSKEEIIERALRESGYSD